MQVKPTARRRAPTALAYVAGVVSSDSSSPMSAPCFILAAATPASCSRGPSGLRLCHLGTLKGATEPLPHNANDLVHEAQEQVQVLRVEVPAPLLAHEGDGVGHLERRLVGPLAGEGVEDIGDGDDPSFDGDGIADQSVRVAAPVPAFVMGQRDQTSETQQFGVGPRQDLAADHEGACASPPTPRP